MHQARRLIPALLVIGSLLAACAEPTPDELPGTPAAGTTGEAAPPVGARCLHAEGDVTAVDAEADIVPVTGMELAPGGDASVGQDEAIDAAEAWWSESGSPDTDVEPTAELHTVIAADDPDIGLEADDSVWVVRYEGVEAPGLTQDITADLACVFVIVNGESGETVVTQYTPYQP